LLNGWGEQPEEIVMHEAEIGVEIEEGPIERGETGIRILYSLVFLVIVNVLETVLVTVVLFELLYTLVTKAPPADGVRRFANRAIAYFYRIARYLTYNGGNPPFPFSEFPAEVEPIPTFEFPEEL
jgi:hypothetical protein